MYSIKLEKEHVSELYHIRETLKVQGIRKPIAMQVREAITEYISKNKNERSPLIATQKASHINSNSTKQN
jgi:hypothetical protein